MTPSSVSPLRERGVDLILNDRLKAATSERAILQSGTEIFCRTLISTVPSALPPVVQKLDCFKERGKLLVNTGLELKDYEGKVWALDDCASIKTVAGAMVPPTAQHAIREAINAPSTLPPPYAAAGARNLSSKVSERWARSDMAPP